MILAEPRVSRCARDGGRPCGGRERAGAALVRGVHSLDHLREPAGRRRGPPGWRSGRRRLEEGERPLAGAGMRGAHSQAAHLASYSARIVSCNTNPDPSDEE